MSDAERPVDGTIPGHHGRGPDTDARNGILRHIFADMMSLSSTGLGETSVTSGDSLITAEGQDELWRVYLKQRVSDLREKLVGVRVGSYQILEEIAAGGMGIVFKARQESPMFTRETALKFMLAGPEAKTDDRERFVAEAKGLASLSHPSLVHIFDSGIEGDLYYFSMELVDGWSLDQEDRASELSLTRRVEIVRDVARALTYLHARGVVHRDVKPGNIMVDQDGRAKLLDFGIAQFSSDPRRRAVQAGTPHFMAPEVIRPQGGFGPIGPATDVYALGAVLYQLAIGRPVFGGDDVGAVLSRTLSEDAQFPKGRRERLPADLQAIIAKSLRKRVQERYSDAGPMAEDLDAFLRRGRLKLPIGVSLALSAATLLVLAFAMRDARAPTVQAQPQLDLAPWRERVREIEEAQPSSAAPIAGLLHRLEEDPDAIRGATLLSDLANAHNAFWREQAQIAFTAAQEAKEQFLSLPVRSDARLEKLFADGSRGLEQGRLRKADKTAHDLLRSAAASFEAGIRVARALQAALDEERRRSEAEVARQRSVQSQREIEEGEGLLDPEGCPLALEAWNGAKRKLEEGDSQLASGDFALANKLFAEAFEGFVKSRALGRASRDVERTSLQASVEAAVLESGRSSARLERNVPGDVLRKLATLREAAAAASKADRLKDLRRLVREHESLWREAQADVQQAEQAAMEARSRALGISIERRLPAPLKEKVSRATEALLEGKSRLRSEEFNLARAAFDKAAETLEQVRDASKKLTQGMVWVDGAGETPGFWIDRTEVTVEDYGRFGRGLPRDWVDQSKRPNLPVVGVTLAAARAFAASREKELPVEAQWRLAAAHDQGGAPVDYPFGSEFDERRVNGAGSEDGFAGLAPALSLEPGASAAGCVHLSGNAAEWVLTERGEGALMGGSYLTEEPAFLRADARYTPRSPFEDDPSAVRAAGFRCVLRPIREERKP